MYYINFYIYNVTDLVHTFIAMRRFLVLIYVLMLGKVDNIVKSELKL